MEQESADKCRSSFQDWAGLALQGPHAKELKVKVYKRQKGESNYFYVKIRSGTRSRPLTNSKNAAR